MAKKTVGISRVQKFYTKSHNVCPIWWDFSFDGENKNAFLSILHVYTMILPP